MNLAQLAGFQAIAQQNTEVNGWIRLLPIIEQFRPLFEAPESEVEELVWRQCLNPRCRSIDVKILTPRRKGRVKLLCKTCGSIRQTADLPGRKKRCVIQHNAHPLPMLDARDKIEA